MNTPSSDELPNTARRYTYSKDIPTTWVETLDNTPIPSPESPIVCHEVENGQYAAHVEGIGWIKLPPGESKMSAKRHNIKFDGRLVIQFHPNGKTGHLNRNGTWVNPPENEENLIFRERVAIYGLRIVDFKSGRSGILKIDGSWYIDRDTGNNSFHKTQIDETNNVRYQVEIKTLLRYINPNQIDTQEAVEVLETVKKVNGNVRSIFSGAKANLLPLEESKKSQ